MYPVRVVESKSWKHKVTGRRVSPYGAVPWTTEADRSNWELITDGFTWEMSNGTVGMCRQPAKSREEAERVMRVILERRAR